MNSLYILREVLRDFLLQVCPLTKGPVIDFSILPHTFQVFAFSVFARFTAATGKYQGIEPPQTQEWRSRSAEMFDGGDGAVEMTDRWRSPAIIRIVPL